MITAGRFLGLTLYLAEKRVQMKRMPRMVTMHNQMLAVDLALIVLELRLWLGHIVPGRRCARG
jgi:hypothetical protein